MPDLDTDSLRLLRTWTEDFPRTGADQYRVFQLRRASHGVAYGWDVDECEELRAPNARTRRAWETNPRHVRYARLEVPQTDPWAVVPGVEWEHERRFGNVVLGVQRARLYRSSELEFMVESWDASEAAPSYACRFVTLQSKAEVTRLLSDPKTFLERLG